MSNYSSLLTIEGSNAHESIAVLEAGLFSTEFELLDASVSFAHTNRDLAHPEEVVVISGTIKISP